MRYLLLILLMTLVLGCTRPDPWRAALAQQQSAAASNAQASTAAQISQAQAASDDARRAQELLQALQAQQAIVAGQAVKAQADAQTAIVASNNAALVLVADRIAEVSRIDYTPLYAGMAALVVVVVVCIVVHGRKPTTPIAPQLLYQSVNARAWLTADGTVHLHRFSDGQTLVYLPGHEMHTRLLIGDRG